MVVMMCLIACIVYWILPVGRGESIRFPNLKLPGWPWSFPIHHTADGPYNLTNVPPKLVGSSVPSMPSIPSGPSVGPSVPSVPKSTPEVQSNERAIDACRGRAPGTCPMTCTLGSECPSGYNCIDGICQCARSTGGFCRRDGDCNCRQNLRCDTIAQKCVPDNFYFYWDEAMENCSGGARRGWFYDPYLVMSDGTSGDFQSGFRCKPQ